MMEDLDPDLFPEGDIPAANKRKQTRRFTPEEAHQRAKESRARYAARKYAENLKKGITFHGKPRRRELTNDIYSRLLRENGKEKRIPRDAKAITEEQYRALRNKDNGQLSRQHVSPISDAEAHDLIAVNQIVKQEAGFHMREGYYSVVGCDGGWMKRRHKGGST